FACERRHVSESCAVATLVGFELLAAHVLKSGSPPRTHVAPCRARRTRFLWLDVDGTASQTGPRAYRRSIRCGRKPSSYLLMGPSGETTAYRHHIFRHHPPPPPRTPRASCGRGSGATLSPTQVHAPQLAQDGQRGARNNRFQSFDGYRAGLSLEHPRLQALGHRGPDDAVLFAGLGVVGHYSIT